MELLVLSLSLHMQQLHLPPDVPQDFSKDVHYTVKAQDGTTTDWTVKWTYGGKVNDGEGFEYFFKKWEISVPTPSNKNKDGFGAVFGNYIIDTQFNFYDKYTGQKVDKTFECDRNRRFFVPVSQ
ncbi:DUF5018 domain-containing protein [Bacteroides ovatus]|nr:DUF5018 domain-containing protein [Bacteroides ovatus]